MALKEALEDVPGRLEEPVENAAARLQVRCRVLEEEIAQEKQQVKRLESQLLKEREHFQSQIASLERKIDEEKAKRRKVSDRVRELLQLARVKESL